MMESTALGAAIVAGRALGVWPTSTPSPPADTFLPAMTSEGIKYIKLYYNYLAKATGSKVCHLASVWKII